jgi:serine/threonine protein kinase
MASKGKETKTNSIALAVLILHSDIAGRTVGCFAGVEEITPEGLNLKTDQAFTDLPEETTIHCYDFEKKIWKLHQGTIISCRQSGPGNFILQVEFHEPDFEKEMFLEDSRILGIMERMDFFMSLKFFQLLPHNTIWAVFNRLAPVCFREGDKIMTQGVKGDALYFIEQGGCYVTIEKDDDLILQATKRKGDMVGEIVLLTDEPRRANVVAATNVQLWRLARDCFELLVQEQSELRKFLTSLVCERLESEGALADLAIGKYIIDHKIGKGAWAVVYRGHHMSLGRDVAIKLLHHEMAMDEDFRERFLQEAKIIAKMHHKNIINIYDIENRFNMLFIIMEYLEGRPVDVLLKKKGKFHWKEVMDLAIQVLQGLSYAHDRGIVHQDIKPDNLFMQNNGTVKILDFGLACPFGSENIEMEGTLQYMSPEQIESYPVDARTDLYGLGITLFQLVTGKLPFPDDDLTALAQMHLEKDIPDPREYAGEMPAVLAEFVMKCGARNPDQRYPDADAALGVLKKLQEEVDTSRRSFPVQHMVSLYLFHSDEQRDEVTALLEEFADKANARGLSVKFTEFSLQ